MFCERGLFERVKGFPEIRASEDVVFGLEVSELADLWFIPDIKVLHIFRESWSSFINNQVLLGKHIIIYRKQLYETFLYKGIMPILLIPFVFSI